MLDESEQVVRDHKKRDTEETPGGNRESIPPEVYVFGSKELTRTGGEIGVNSRILRLASIARYRKNRRVTTAEKAPRSDQERPASRSPN